MSERFWIHDIHTEQGCVRYIIDFFTAFEVTWLVRNVPRGVLKIFGHLSERFNIQDGDTGFWLAAAY